MNKTIIQFVIVIFIIGWGNYSAQKINVVNNPEELRYAIENAVAGDEIVMADGAWRDIVIKFSGKGTEDKPITLRAETPGQVSLEGQSCIKLGGEYLIVDGLYFKNGYTPGNTVIDFRINEDKIANHCRVTNTVIEDYTQPNRYNPDHWVEFRGRHNKLDRCYLAGKSNQGPTIRVYLNGNEHIRNYHQITNNHFGPRPRKGGPKAETMQIGASNTSMTPSYVKVADNFFEKCNGEVEIISSKSNFNEFRNNIFFECEGSLVMRHGNYCVVDGNIFIGNEASSFIGGIRVINTGHWVTNNYFYKLKADEFRSPLAVMNGIPKSPLNRYNQVTDAVVAYNTWVDCESPWQFSVGANMGKKDVLPDREIRSARPKRVVVANNLIYNSQADEMPIKAYDKVDGVLFESNLIDNQESEFKQRGFKNVSLQMNKLSDWLYVPSEDAAGVLKTDYMGFGFDEIKSDLFGNPRSDNIVGAAAGSAAKSIVDFDKGIYGPDWFSTDKPAPLHKRITVNSTDGQLSQIIKEAAPGSLIELSAGQYKIDESLVIGKDVTIRAKKGSGEVNIIYSGEENTPLFEMHAKGNLSLENISLAGSSGQFTFAPLAENMFFSYNLNVENCKISKFKNVLKAYRGSFADIISFSNTIISDCENGLVLAAETDDKGDYNAEFVNITGSTFDNIQQDIINFYRGGYDESTIGGNLLVQNSKFTNCGKMDDDKILLKTRGIINVEISNNTFTNNPVKLIALLWGEKNNRHSGNDITDSGEIRVDKYLKQKLVY